MRIATILSLLVALSLVRALPSDVFQMPAGFKSLELVTVGDPGNAADTNGFGAVAYLFQIGKYEVTTAQYVEFLNAKAKADPDGNLWNNDMDKSRSGEGPRCEIRRSGEKGSYRHTVAPEFANRPVNFVSFWDAGRFCNWLHNGQGDGDTEDGAYTLKGYRGRDGRKVQRNPGARWFIPSEDEWYKAAYYDPHKPGGPGYWDYPTRSDAQPNRDFAGTNAANYYAGGFLDPAHPFTEAGAFSRSSGPYGTFDQAGNVFEWTDSTPTGLVPPFLRCFWGGSADSADGGRNIRAPNLHLHSNSDAAFVGFRVAGAAPGTLAETGSARDSTSPREPTEISLPPRPRRGPETNRMSGHAFILTQDSRDICYMAPLGQAQDWIRSWYRQAFAAGVTVFVADVATPDIVVTRDTPTGEIVGGRADVGQAEEKLERRYRIIKELMRQDTDVLHLLSEEGRQTKALVLAGMRMNDAHHGPTWQPRWDNLLFPEFALENPQWCITYRDGTRDVTLNYAIPEVQAHRLQILRELATNYDIDGVELDWMRQCRHFPAGRQREHLQDLTHFVGQVRAMLDEVAQEKGVARMILGHRVPVTLGESLDIGLDVETWARQGYADYLVPMDFQHVDPNVRTDEFVQAVQGTLCRVYPSFGNTPYSSGSAYGDHQGTPDRPRRRSRMSTPEQFRAVAANWFAWGADGGAFYNIIAWPPERQEFAAEVISIMSDPRKALAGPRHYLYVPTWKDHAGGVGPTGRHNALSLAFTAKDAGVRQVFTFRMADGRNGEKLEGWLRLRVFDAIPEDEFSLDLNGTTIPLDKFSIVHLPDGEWSGRTSRPFGVPEDGTFDWPPNVRFEISLEHCPPFRGDNELGVTLVKKSPANATALVMEAVEVTVR
jgi:formylglycine-generating enzyme required for sulfatase activity